MSGRAPNQFGRWRMGVCHAPRRGPSPLFVWFAGSAKTLRGRGGGALSRESTSRIPRASYTKFSPYPSAWPEVGTSSSYTCIRPHGASPVSHRAQGLTCVGRSSARSSNPSPSLTTIALPMSAPSARGATLWMLSAWRSSRLARTQASRSRRRHASYSDLWAGFSQVPGSRGNLAGPWAVVQGVGEETRRRLALTLGGCTAGMAGTPGPSREYAPLGGLPSPGYLLCVLSSSSPAPSRAHPGYPGGIHPDLGRSRQRTATRRDRLGFGPNALPPARA
ncbi:hypothetical protein NN561_017689 [Cricetulus griseus]